MATGAPVRTPRDHVDQLLALLRRTARYWWAAATVVVLDGIVSFALAWEHKPVYKSETIMLYRETIRTSYLGGEEDRDPARKLGLRLKEMMLSRARLQSLIDEFKLYPDIVDERGYVDAVDEMRNHITFRPRDGDTFGLSFVGEDADRVQKVTARLADVLIEENAKSRTQQASETREYLEAEKKHAADELEAKFVELEKFLAKHPEFTQDVQKRKEAQTSAAKSGDPALLPLEREAARLKERLGMPASHKATLDPRLAARITEAEADLAAAQRELAEKSRMFTEQHPDVRAARQRVRQADDRLSRLNDPTALLELAKSSRLAPQPADEPEVDRAALQAQLDRINREIEAYKARKARQNPAGKDDNNAKTGENWIVKLESDWARLNRDVTEARERVSALETRLFKVELVAGSETGARAAQIDVIDPAYRPMRPFKGAKRTILGIGVVVSFLFGSLLALVAGLLDDRLYDRLDVERLELAPLLVVVPRRRAERKGRDG